MYEGSENGAASGFLLAQHKEQLGVKWIPRINVSVEGGTELRILFWVEDASREPSADHEDEELARVLSAPPASVPAPAASLSSSSSSDSSPGLQDREEV